MQNRAIARLALFLGGLAAAISWWAFAAQHTILDPKATQEAAYGLLQSPPIAKKAADSLTSQLDSLLPSTVAGNNTAKTRQAATAALTDPRVRQAFSEAIGSIHQQLLTKGGTHDQLIVDTAAVTTAVQDALARVDPSMAAQLSGKSLSMKFDTSHLPNLNRTSSTAPRVALLAAFAAVAFWALAILLHPNHFVAIRRIGRRIAAIGAVPVIMWVILPAALAKLNAEATQTFSPLARSYGKRLALPAIIVLFVGLGIWIAGRIGDTAVSTASAFSRRTKRTPSESAPRPVRQSARPPRSAWRRARVRRPATSSKRTTPGRVDIKI